MNNMRIEVNRRNDAVICWPVEVKEVTPNTVLAPDSNVTLLVKINETGKAGEKEQSNTTTRETTVYELFNPGKEVKKIGGNRPYAHCEIIAFDRSNFKGYWGFGGNDGIPFVDPDYRIDCKLVANGSYEYKVVSHNIFSGQMPVLSGPITCVAMEDKLRSAIVDAVRAYMSFHMNGKDIAAVNNDIAFFRDGIKNDELPKILEQYGLEVTSFAISHLNYSPDHMEKRRKLNDAMVTNKLSKLKNDTDKTDIDTQKEYVHGVEIPLIDAYGRVKHSDAEKAQANRNNNQNNNQNNYVTRYCSGCGAQVNPGDMFCSKCGKRL